MHPNNRRLLRIGLDFLLLLSVGLIPLITKLNGFSPYRRGFFCDDETIQHPFHESTVPSAVLGSVCALLPLFFMLVIETILYKQGYNNEYEPLCAGKFTFNACVVTIGAKFGVYLFGLGCTQTFTDITKYTIGRLRPHFIAVCRPNYALFNCSDGYIELDVCTGDSLLIHKARLSFLSGHTSIATYAALYTALYLQARMLWDFSRLFKHILQIVVVIMGWMCALSRISDYKHHAEDVIMGAVLGISTCLIVICLVSDLPPPVVVRAVQYHSQRKVSRTSALQCTDTKASDPELGSTQCRTSFQHI